MSCMMKVLIFSHGELLCGLCIGIVLLQITVLANLKTINGFCLGRVVAELGNRA